MAPLAVVSHARSALGNETPVKVVLDGTTGTVRSTNLSVGDDRYITVAPLPTTSAEPAGEIAAPRRSYVVPPQPSVMHFTEDCASRMTLLAERSASRPRSPTTKPSRP